MRRINVVVATMVLALVNPVWAGPQHWGFGFSYLAAIEDSEGTRRLVVYEPPLHAKNDTWPSRWLDRSTVLVDVAGGGLAVGDFWPASFGKEYLATVSVSGGNLTVKVYEPPECFSTRPWALKSTSTAIPVTGTFLGATAGNLRRSGKDQLLVAMQNGSTIRIVILTPPASVNGVSWTKTAESSLPSISGTYLGLACGDFWNEDTDFLSLAFAEGGQTRLVFYSYQTTANSFSTLVADAATDLPGLQVNGLTAADYEKDGFDVLTLASAAGSFQLRAAPAKPGQNYKPGVEYNGKALSGQWLPGNGGSSSLVVMTGRLETTADGRPAIAAGRLFGYIDTDLNARQSMATAGDAAIAFAHRSPTKDACGPYGWPANGQTVTYTINIHNTGAIAVPASGVRLKVWYNRPNRNADTDPGTCDTPDFDEVLTESLPAYNSNSPTYVTRAVSFPWPYSLVPASTGATWQKVNVETVGERWVVAVIECDGDANGRDNRYEMALHGLTFHPILRNQAALADRQPTVLGDPPSKEYLCRKLADAVQCMWERSQTQDGQDVLQRLWFDSYEFGWPDDAADRDAAWQAVQSKYEGWRELDGWWGVYQGWERFNWGDGGAELHETGHLFHPVGDLYQYYVSPVFTGGATMADGTPVQIRTWMWPPDSYGSGHTRISWPACEMMRRALVGVRNKSIDAWWTLAPARTFVRVLDRDGDPVPGAEITLWPERNTVAAATGLTDADGRWETTAWLGPATTDAFGRKHYYSPPTSGGVGAQTGTQIYTVKIGSDYQDCAILGTGETAAHSQHTRMGHSWTDEASWTWDFHTHYKPGATAPAFTLTAAVQGHSVSLGIAGASPATYRIYRRWEPAYIRTQVGEYVSSGQNLTVAQNMAAADSYGSNRFRATYEVTQVTGSGESLPRMVQVTGISGARGITGRKDGRLLLAANAGIANPMCQVLDGTTPHQELFYHFRFGHTANKVVPSRLVDGKYYATLAFSDMEPDYRFDVVNPPTAPSFGYDVRNDIATLSAKAFTTSSPFLIQCHSVQDAVRYQPGDQVDGPAASARVTQITEDLIITDAAVFAAGSTSLSFGGSRLAGRPGTNAALRELSNARGLDTILFGGNEYIVIADTGNRRVVVWTAETAPAGIWQSADSTARPAAIATHPVASDRFFMLDRRSSGMSKLFLFSFDGTTLTIEPGYPVSIPVGDATDVTEMGLASAEHPATGTVMLLVTDARLGKVLQLSESGDSWLTTATYTQPAGVYAGSTVLSRPVDVAFAARPNMLACYAVDGSNRVVLLGTIAPPVANEMSAQTRVHTAVAITLTGSSPRDNALTYAITSLPAQGSLRDPLGGVIQTAPYHLAGNGQIVQYLPAIGYAGTDSFQFTVNDGEDSAPATVSINVGGPEPVYVFPMDSDPGWNVEGLWGFGTPLGAGGEYGTRDPTAGYTGGNVYGYNLAGDYESGLAEQHLTTTVLNCSHLSQVTLRFWRWLGVEQNRYDHASVRVSSDGANWVTVWQNPSQEVVDAGWSFQALDISAFADHQPTVSLRWTMGTTDKTRRYCGWNIDDVEVWGVVQAGDCNGNGTPDDQDIIGGTSEDCNHNGLPDECDIAAGSSKDINHSGIPDECEEIVAVPGDFDLDGDVDMDDFAHLQACLTAVGQTSLPTECTGANLDRDPHPYVDAADLEVFLRCMSGAGLPANSDCAN
ncbi:MAG: hypothetical protein KA354_16190 [Phycisphaerae bacterium]|nr:hypothetical protein [Phycisphaerae bacterium]